MVTVTIMDDRNIEIIERFHNVIEVGHNWPNHIGVVIADGNQYLVSIVNRNVSVEKAEE
jgi:hypothetical protein